jgi:hypothetical protein
MPPRRGRVRPPQRPFLEAVTYVMVRSSNGTALEDRLGLNGGGKLVLTGYLSNPLALLGPLGP